MYFLLEIEIMIVRLLRKIKFVCFNREIYFKYIMKIKSRF